MSKQQVLIDRIHAEFDQAQDRLLLEAKNVLANASLVSNQAVESIGDRLKRIGFVNTPVAKQSESIQKERAVQQKKLVETEEQAKLIEYYKQTYPFLKFLTESELDRICQKYNLVYASVDSYVKDVPEKNLRDIEQAQPMRSCDERSDDTIVRYGIYDMGSQWMRPSEALNWPNPIKIVNRSIHDQYSFKEYLRKTYGISKHISFTGTEFTHIRHEGLFIAAPKEHFDLNGKTQKGLGFFEVFKTKIEDPIVFRYVRGGIQVLTKWGLEANDPALVVPVLN